MDKITKEQQEYINYSYAKQHILSFMEVYGDTEVDHAIIKGMENCIEELVEELEHTKSTHKQHTEELKVD